MWVPMNSGSCSENSGFSHCTRTFFWRAGTNPILEKQGSENEWMQVKIFMWVPMNSGSCSENSGFRIAQGVRHHSENGISRSENYCLNSKSCSENSLERSQSSENGLFTPRAFFLRLGWLQGSSILKGRRHWLRVRPPGIEWKTGRNPKLGKQMAQK